jgi:hypothetical protein
MLNLCSLPTQDIYFSCAFVWIIKSVLYFPPVVLILSGYYLLILIHWLVFVIQVRCVFCEIWVESVSILRRFSFSFDCFKSGNIFWSLTPHGGPAVRECCGGQGGDPGTENSEFFRTGLRPSTEDSVVDTCSEIWGLSKVHPRTGHEGSEGVYRYSPTLSLTSALDGLGDQRRAPAVLPPEKTRCTPYRRLGGSQSRSGMVQKISPPPGFDPRTVQPAASLYTGWAILAPRFGVKFGNNVG